MQSYKVFLASSITEFRDLRNHIGEFVFYVNQALEEQQIKIELKVCEFLPAHMSQTRKQDEYNTIIRACDAFYAIFNRSYGKYSIEECEEAHKKFKEEGHPEMRLFVDSSSKDVSKLLEDRFADEISILKYTYENQIKIFLLKDFLNFFSMCDLIDVKDDFLKVNGECVLRVTCEDMSGLQ